MMLEPLIISARTFLVITPSCPALITNNATQRRRNILIFNSIHHKVREFEFQFNTNGWVTKTSEPGPSSHLTPGQMWSSFDRWVLYHKIWADFIFLSPFKHCVGSWLVTNSDSLQSVEATSVTWSQYEELLSGPGYENCHAVFMTSWQGSAVSRHNYVTWARAKTDTRTWPLVIITTRGSRLCSHENPPSFPPEHPSLW